MRAFLSIPFGAVVWVSVLGTSAGPCPSGAHTVSGRHMWVEGRSTKAPRDREARGVGTSWVPEPSVRVRRQVAIYLLAVFRDQLIVGSPAPRTQPPDTGGLRKPR